LAGPFGSDAIGIKAEIDLVEIELEDLVLAVGLFDTEGQNRFLDLSVKRLVGRQQEVLGNLLGDGGCTDEAAAGTDVLHIHCHGAHQPADIDAGMIVEILVFSRKKRCLDAIGNGLDRHEKPIFTGVFLHQRAVAGVNASGHRRRVFRKYLVVGKFLGDDAQIDRRRSRRAQKQEAA